MRTRKRTAIDKAWQPRRVPHPAVKGKGPMGEDTVLNARATLVARYTEALERAPRGSKGRVRELWVEAYNTGASLPRTFEVLGPVSWQTLERWKVSMRDYGPEALGDLRGKSRRGTSLVTREQAEVLLKVALHPNNYLASEAIRLAKLAMRSRGIQDGLSDRTYRRWLDEWKSLHYDEWVWYREGVKGWNDKIAYYVERDYSRIQVGDVLVADGHVLNFETLDPWTGKAKRMTLIVWYDMASSYPLGWEIMPTENTAAIATALRRAIMRLGKFPRVLYMDNGKAFASKFFKGADLKEQGFEGLFGRLPGLAGVIYAWPYHAQSKPVERFFRDFAEIEKALPSYTGTSIERKPPRMRRGEFLHRRIYEKAGAGPVTLEEAHQAIAWWIDQYASRPHQAGRLKGLRSGELFEAGRGPGVDQAELNHLMMQTEIRTISRRGIRMFGRHYYHPALYGRRHPVTVKYDLQDQARVLVYDKNGEFICSASPPLKVHPAAALLGDDEDKEELAKQLELRRSQEKETTRAARAFLRDEVLPDHHRRLREAGIVGDAHEHGPAATREQALPALSDIEQEAEASIMLDREASREALMAEIERLEELPDRDRYLGLIEVSARGDDLRAGDRTFLRLFEQSDEYKDNVEFYQDQAMSLAVVYSGEPPGAKGLGAGNKAG